MTATVANGGPTAFVFPSVGNWTINAAYSGSVKWTYTHVSPLPCSFTTSVDPSTEVAFGELVTVTPSGNCVGYSYAVVGSTACPATGSGGSFQTRFAAVGSAQLNVSGTAGGADTTIKAIGFTVGCPEIGGPSAGLANSPVCFTAQQPDPSATLTWLAPGGDPLTGSGPDFCTTYAAPGVQTVELSVGMAFSQCEFTTNCSQSHDVLITAPPPTVQINTAGPILLLGSGSADVSAVGSPAGGTYSWSSNPALLNIVPTNASQVSVSANSPGVTTLSVTYTTSAGTSAPANIQVHAIDISGVAWEGVQRNDGQTNLTSDNPSTYNGGYRIFPDRNHPPGSQGVDDPHDRVMLTITLTAPPPSGTSVTVHARLFDPDHYSGDTAFDPNGALEANDNVRHGSPMAIAVGAVLKSSNFSVPATSVQIQGDGVAKELRLGLEIMNPQPGNNWRAAVGFDATELLGIVIGGDGQTLKRSSAPGAPNWPNQQQSPLLTTWRKLHVEIDRMANPVLNVGAGRSRFDNGIAVRSGSSTVLAQPSGGDTIDAAQADQFQTGQIELRDGLSTVLGSFDVASNTTGSPATVGISGVVPLTTATFVALVDDDIDNTSPFKVAASDDMTVDTSWWAEKLEPALVLPTFGTPEVVANNSNVVSFDVQVGDATPPSEAGAMRAVFLQNKQSSSSRYFWLVYQLGAFQGRLDEEGDPLSDLFTMGVSSGVAQPSSDAEAGTIVYAETARDLAETHPSVSASVATLRGATSIHEVGHEFGMVGHTGFGSLMDTSATIVATGPQDLNWSGAALRLIMLTRYPGHDPKNPN